jgi:hypothetical protein
MKQDGKNNDNASNLAVEDEIIKKIGDRIKQIRKDAGYKNYENFAFENDINRVQYGRMESGRNFTMRSLLRILAIHKMSVKDFFDRIQ